MLSAGKICFFTNFQGIRNFHFASILHGNTSISKQICLHFRMLARILGFEMNLSNFIILFLIYFLFFNLIKKC